MIKWTNYGIFDRFLCWYCQCHPHLLPQKFFWSPNFQVGDQVLLQFHRWWLRYRDNSSHLLSSVLKYYLQLIRLHNWVKLKFFCGWSKIFLTISSPETLLTVDSRPRFESDSMISLKHFFNVFSSATWRFFPVIAVANILASSCSLCYNEIYSKHKRRKAKSNFWKVRPGQTIMKYIINLHIRRIYPW